MNNKRSIRYGNMIFCGECQVKKHSIDHEVKIRAISCLKKIFEDLIMTAREQKVYHAVSKEHVMAVKEVISHLIIEIKSHDIKYEVQPIIHAKLSLYEHSVNTAILSLIIGVRMNLCDDELIEIGIGAILHDIGKLDIDEAILSKPGSLTDLEFDIIKTHTLIGYDMIRGNEEFSCVSRNIILYHHERLDGSGYPYGLMNVAISMQVRIVSMADVFDAMVSDRSYRKGMTIHQAMSIIKKEAGIKLDHEIFSILKDVIISSISKISKEVV